MNTEAVRAFVTVMDEGRFQDAALILGISQQAVSKRVASLEKLLGVPLLRRDARRTEPTVDGRAFLPHARALLEAADRAVRSVRPETRALRVDVRGRRLASAGLLHGFHAVHPEVPLDLLCLPDARAAVSALLDGSIDAAFSRVPDDLPAPIRHVPVYDEPLELLVGPRHPLAGARTASMADLRHHRLWVPGIVPGSEWADYYREMSRTFGLVIDSTGPNFGLEHLLDVIADSPAVATFIGARLRVVWPARHELRRIELTGPTPVYPWSLLWHVRAADPGLTALREHLTAEHAGRARPEASWPAPAG